MRLELVSLLNVAPRRALFSRECPSVVHFRIWPDSIWVHNSIAWDDVHDGQHARNERLRHQNTKLSERLSEVLDEPESVRARWPRQHGARCGALGNEYRTTRDLVPALTKSIGRPPPTREKVR